MVSMMAWLVTSLTLSFAMTGSFTMGVGWLISTIQVNNFKNEITPEALPFYFDAPGANEVGRYDVHGRFFEFFVLPNDTDIDINARLMALNTSIINLGTEVDGLTIDLSQLNSTVQGHTADIASLNTDITNIDGRLTTVEGTINGMLVRIDVLNTTLITLSSNFTLLSQDFTMLETYVQTSITGIQQDVNNINSTVQTLSSNIVTLNQQIVLINGTLQYYISSLTLLNQQVLLLNTTLYQHIADYTLLVQRVDQLNSSYISILNDIVLINQRIDLLNVSLQNTIQTLTTNVAQLTQQISQVNSTLQSTIQTFTTSINLLSTQVSQLNSTVQTLANLPAQFAQLNTTVQGLVTSINQMNSTIIALSASISQFPTQIAQMNTTIQGLSSGNVVLTSASTAYPNGKVLTGTTNQITFTTGASTTTASLPQNIHTGATPTFAGETLTGAQSMTNNSPIRFGSGITSSLQGPSTPVANALTRLPSANATSVGQVLTVTNTATMDTAWTTPSSGSSTPRIYAGTTPLSLVNPSGQFSIVPTGVGSLTIPANTMTAGSTIRYTVYGNLYSSSSAFLSVQVKLNSANMTFIRTQGLTNTAAFFLTGLITFQNTGASVGCIGSADINPIYYFEQITTAVGTCSTTVANTITMTGTFSAPTTNRLQITTFLVEVV